MATLMAEYYTDELTGWTQSLAGHGREIEDLEQRLGDVIRRNSITGIAEKVEAHQTRLNDVSNKFYRLQVEMQQQHAALKTDSKFIEDNLINPDTEKQQAALRREVLAAEKEYIDVKFACYQFLSQLFNRREI